MKNKDFVNDYYRFYGEKKVKLLNVRRNIFLRYMFYFRKGKSSKNKFQKKYYFHKAFLIGKKYGIEIPSTVELGTGFLIIHPYGVTINSSSKIGNNCTFLKGVTIGNEKRGRRKGAPTIGNNVYIGLNSTVVGNVVVGDNVLIAPNTFVNFDVPSNSIVIGSPGKIISSPNATSDYINNIV